MKNLLSAQIQKKIYIYIEYRLGLYIANKQIKYINVMEGRNVDKYIKSCVNNVCKATFMPKLYVFCI